MFDASSKIPEGILFGSSHNLGNFDECVNVVTEMPGKGHEQDENVLKGQYCLAKVNLSGFHKKSDDTELPSHSAWGTLKVNIDSVKKKKKKIF